MATIAAIAGVALAAGGQIASHMGAQANAKASGTAATLNNLANASYRDELMRYQNETWAQDLAYAQESLGYQEAEFARQIEWTGKAQESVRRNADASAFTLMVRGIEETIASTFQTTALAKQGQAARATYSAKERGVEGNSVEAVLGDVWRQEGEARTVVEMNRDVTGRQLFREALGLDAQADTQMSQIAGSVRTYAPNAPLRTPGPINPVNPQAGTTAPSMGALVGGIGNALIGGFNSYNTMTRQTADVTMEKLSSWLGRQFTFGSTAPAT